ncbi:unnamed protein product [Larinioides sclopetarius]|uniref:Uncharacterized protein n=1 Tax=Larinioides sclopetarius TaxID=280406 RepID=A0AAV2BTU4_9ARAC
MPGVWEGLHSRR